MASRGSKFEDFSSELQATNLVEVKQSAGSAHGLEVNTCRPVEHRTSVALRRDCNDVLTVPQQPDGIQVIPRFEVEPLQGEVGDAPAAQSADVAQLPPGGANPAPACA